MFHRTCIYLQVHMALQPRKPTSTSSLPLEPHISHMNATFKAKTIIPSTENIRRAAVSWRIHDETEWFEIKQLVGNLWQLKYYTSSKHKLKSCLCSRIAVSLSAIQLLGQVAVTIMSQDMPCYRFHHRWYSLVIYRGVTLVPKLSRCSKSLVRQRVSLLGWRIRPA
jgi:hypothetical protein